MKTKKEIQTRVNNTMFSLILIVIIGTLLLVINHSCNGQTIKTGYVVSVESDTELRPKVFETYSDSLVNLVVNNALQTTDFDIKNQFTTVPYYDTTSTNKYVCIELKYIKNGKLRRMPRKVFKQYLNSKIR